jgi:hypothetical protein
MRLRALCGSRPTPADGGTESHEAAVTGARRSRGLAFACVWVSVRRSSMVTGWFNADAGPRARQS